MLDKFRTMIQALVLHMSKIYSADISLDGQSPIDLTIVIVIVIS